MYKCSRCQGYQHGWQWSSEDQFALGDGEAYNEDVFQYGRKLLDELGIDAM